MILGTKARYAVMAMVDLAAAGSAKPVRLTDIAKRQEIPLPYLEQIFARLKNGGLLKSVTGPGGGYLLARPASEVNIADIVVAVDESLRMTRCDKQHEGGCMASKAQCITHNLWDGLGRQIYGYLQGVTLKDVGGKATIR